jgi:Heterokaryon incompatibility protein (HET)
MWEPFHSTDKHLLRTVDGSGVPYSPPNYVQVGLPRLPRIGSPTYYEILSQWLIDCDNKHPGCHQNPEGTRIPTRLIDVGQGKKDASSVYLRVTAKWKENQTKDLRYIALSHPWGDESENDHFGTTTKNVNDRLLGGIPINDLPSTFKHAVQVTQELGVQYLWIDSLCIIQGKDGDFVTEAKHMETVFSSAYCVIAASRAIGTSSGFLEERSNRKFVRFDVASPAHPFYICEAIDDFKQDVIDGHLNKRGWVLQERALARRTIYFTENQTYWECGEGIRCETLTRMRK